MLLPLLNVWQQKHTLPHAQGVRVFSRKHVVWSLSCRSLSHRFPHPRHYKGVSFRSFATKATVLLGSPHSPGATQASPPHVHTSPAPTGTFPVISRRVLFYATASPKASCQSWVWGRDKSGPYAQVGPSARAHRTQSVARRVSLRGARAGRASG